MSLTWLEELLPQGVVSSGTKICWLVFFALFPLAYTGGVMLEMGQDRPARMPGAEDRPAVIRTAQQFAASKGIDVANWNKYTVAETRSNLLAFYDTTKGPEVTAASMLAPAREVRVLFRSPDQRHDFRVYLSLTGRVTGYDSGKFAESARNVSEVGIVSIQTTTTDQHNEGHASGGSAKTPGDQELEAIARQALAENVTLSKLVQLGPAKVTSSEDDALQKEVTWDVSPTALKGLTLHIDVFLRGSRVVGQHIEADVDKGYGAKKPKVPIIFNALYAFTLLFGAFYAAYRYAKRTLQKEVSHWRTLVVAALFAISYGEFAYSIALDQMATRISAETFAKTVIFAYVFAGITFVILGLLVGIGYGSGEGELREAYPGKLTSLDALLAGRIFSRDVAASLLFGAAAAGWLMLGQHALGHFLESDVTALQNDVLRYTFARLPWSTLIVGRQHQSLLIAVTGLLLPASFLLRRPTRKRRRFFWLILFALLSVLGEAAKNPNVGQALLTTIVLASALLVPFFAFDLLAAMVSLSALAFVNELVKLTQVIPSWKPFALWLAVLALVTLAVAVYLALHGRRVREEDVRPLYAKNLAERMAMQAEILAAREAQLRLLPQAAPELPGVQLAAYCLPARGVGGDFYDFFRLDANRVGIFVAQGGDQGLASALRIALAKGLLMHASQQSHSPTQIIVGLEETITELLEGGGSDISFAYGVMDTRRNLLSYARIGSSPRLVIYREGAALNASSQLERKVIEGERLKSAASIYEGAAQAHPGDFLIFVTEGLISLRTRRFARREHQWLDDFMEQLARPEEPLQTSLVTALLKYQNHAPDDLTAVVLRIVESQAVLQEGVA